MKTIMKVNTTYASIYERGFNHYCTKVFILPNKYMCIFMALYLELIFNISKDQTKHHVVSLHFQVNYTYNSSFIKQVNHHSYHLQLGHVPHESWKFTNFCSLETCGHLDKKVNIFQSQGTTGFSRFSSTYSESMYINQTDLYRCRISSWLVVSTYPSEK